MSAYDEILRGLEELGRRAQNLPEHQQVQIAEALGAINMMIDGVSILKSEDVTMQVGPVSFKVNPEEVVRRVSKNWKGPPPLKVPQKTRGGVDRLVQKLKEGKRT